MSLKSYKCRPNPMPPEIAPFLSSLAQETQLALRLRIYRLVCMATAGLCLIVIPPVNWWQHLPLWVHAGDLLLGFAAVFCLWESKRGRHHLLGFFGILVLLLDLVWFFNAGSDGSITYYFLPVVLYPVAVFDGKKRWTLLVLLALNVVALFLAEYHFPQLVTPFANRSDRIIDLLTGIICCGFSIALILGLIMRAYDREQEQLRELARDYAASEQRLRLALEASRQSWFEFDLGARVARIGGNPDRMGFPAGSFQISFAEWRARIHSQDLAAALEAIDSVAARECDIRFEHRVRSDSGNWQWIRVLARGVDAAADGRPRKVVGTLSNVTELKEMEARLLRIQRLESIGALAGGVAHHLNNLLTPISVGSELLRKTLTRADDRELADQMADGAKRASDIVRQLVTFSRASGHARGRIDARELLESIAGEVRPHLTGSILFDADIPSDLPAITGDPVQLRQAVLNIITNAREAMPRGGTLKIHARPVSLPRDADARDSFALRGEFVAISVSDTGRGIPPDNLGRIFDPFFTTKEIGQGEGLGLSTAHGIITAHGGTIGVKSTLEQGSTFELLLPVAAA